MSTRGHTQSSAVDESCQRAHASLRGGARAPADRVLAEHLAGCPACAALAADPRLVEALDAAPALALPIEPWLAELELTLLRERGSGAWLRSRPTAQRAGLAMLGAGLVPLLVWIAWRRVDASVYPTGRLLLELGAVLVPAALVLAMVMRPLSRPSWPRGRQWLVVGLAVVGVLVGPVLEPAHHAHPASLTGTGAQLVPRALVCLAIGTALAVPGLAWLVALCRGAERPGWLGLLAGLVGGVAIFLHCPIVAPAHLLLGHASVLLVVAGLVVVAGRSVSRGRGRHPRA